MKNNILERCQICMHCGSWSYQQSSGKIFEEYNCKLKKDILFKLPDECNDFKDNRQKERRNAYQNKKSV